MAEVKSIQVDLNIEYASIVDIQSLTLLFKGKNQPNFTLHKVNLGEIASNLLSVNSYVLGKNPNKFSCFI